MGDLATLRRDRLVLLRGHRGETPSLVTHALLESISEASGYLTRLQWERSRLAGTVVARAVTTLLEAERGLEHDDNWPCNRLRALPGLMLGAPSWRSRSADRLAPESGPSVSFGCSAADTHRRSGSSPSQARCLYVTAPSDPSAPCSQACRFSHGVRWD